MDLTVGVRWKVPGLQTGVRSQPEDRCCVRYVSRPRAGVPVPFLLDGLRPFVQWSRGGARWCWPGEDLAGQALSVKPGSRWASLGRVVACLLARGAPWLRGRASAAGSGGPLPGLPDLELPGRLLLPGMGWVGAASRPAVRPGQAVFYFKTCCPLRARQLWVCSVLLLTAAAVGATQPSAAKMRLGPLPLPCCSAWPGLQ